MSHCRLPNPDVPHAADQLVVKHEKPMQRTRIVCIQCLLMLLKARNVFPAGVTRTSLLMRMGPGQTDAEALQVITSQVAPVPKSVTPYLMSVGAATEQHTMKF